MWIWVFRCWGMRETSIFCKAFELVSLVSIVYRKVFVNEKLEPDNSENVKRVRQKDTKYGTEVLEVYDMILRNIFPYISKLSKILENSRIPQKTIQ